MRHLTGRLRDAVNVQQKNMDEMMEWEEALKEVSSLKGLESEKIDNGHEGTLVKKVVRKVMSELKGLFLLNVPEQLVGIDDHVEHMMSYIDANFSDTNMIGVYGMGGIGKTTLAKVLYNKLYNHYESRSFVADIRETSKVKGLECIQKQLIFDISGDSCDVSNVDYGISILKSRSTSKKVLILLDDVDDNTHLNALIGDGSWFKAGSIVIITTRDKSILDKARVRHKYQLNELLSDQSLVLFSRHAFRKDSPPSDYEVISRGIVSTTGGLPLALEVIGSFLCEKTKEAWKATSKKLEKVLDKKVQDKLRISYDALDFEDQQIFLDIACFFIGSSKQNPIYMWEACGFFPGKGIEVLSLMSLIKIDEDGDLMMHDQLRDLGRKIVRLENQREPQERSRLWIIEEAKDVICNNKVKNLPVNILPVTYNYQSLGQRSYSSDDLPRNVVITLSQGSLVKSMDFHPVQQIMLLVGTNTGDVMVWEVDGGARIAMRKFKVWNLGTCSMVLQASLANDYTTSVNRVMWSPDGILFGVAYSKHMVHIYSHHGGDDIRNHLELEAHVGSVNDLAFSCPNKQLCVVTCGEDGLIQVWDAVTGAKQHTFEGHEAPVYSIFPHNKENIQFIFSTAIDGKIKAWFYDNMGSRVDYDAPGHSFSKMAYSTDKTRLFLCGTNKEGESYLVEWNESEGAVKRTYHGLGKRSGGFVQFDTAKNRFLAVGDKSMVKFWDMDNNNILTSTDADNGLPASPCIRFNKEGILLAVSASDNSIKILANADGIRLLRTMDNWPFDASRITPGPLMKDSESMADVKPRIADDSRDKSRNWKLTEINEPSQCRSIRLPDNSTAMRINDCHIRTFLCGISFPH